MSGVVVVIPALNEEAAIRSVVEGVLAAGLPVIVIDDGSTDDTAVILREVPVTVVSHAVRKGKGQSLREGFAEARRLGFDAAITMDGDGQHHAEDLPRLLSMHECCAEALLLCARTQGRSEQPPLRRFGNRCADFFVGWSCRQPITDSQCGHRLYPLSLFDHVRLPKSDGFVFESELLIDAARAGTPILSIPIRARYHPDRRDSHFRPFLDVMRIIRMISGKLIPRGLDPVGLYRSLRKVRTHDVA